jgi:hypothetical protein
MTEKAAEIASRWFFSIGLQPRFRMTEKRGRIWYCPAQASGSMAAGFVRGRDARATKKREKPRSRERARESQVWRPVTLVKLDLSIRRRRGR